MIAGGRGSETCLDASGWEGRLDFDGAVVIGRFARAIFTINASRNYHVIFDVAYWNKL